jgi:hypothetical protein
VELRPRRVLLFTDRVIHGPARGQSIRERRTATRRESRSACAFASAGETPSGIADASVPPPQLRAAHCLGFSVAPLDHFPRSLLGGVPFGEQTARHIASNATAANVVGNHFAASSAASTSMASLGVVT